MTFIQAIQPLRVAACAAVLLAAVSSPSRALADASSWMFVGGGAANIEQVRRSAVMPTQLQLDLGMGTSPNNPFIFGGLMRTSTFFGQGTDLALLQRTATRGYALGDYGLALDLGAYQRWWGPESTGFLGSLNLGAPWGVSLGLNGGLGTNNATMVGFVVGIDWARLTVHRRSGSSWWPNYRLPLGGDDDVARRW